MLLELKGEKGMSLRLELEWMALAISSLPVPLSPVTRTVELESATLSTMPRIFFSRGLRPMMLSKEKRSLIVFLSWVFSRFSFFSLMTRSTLCFSSMLLKGFCR